jgi:hypothetical protein
MYWINVLDQDRLRNESSNLTARGFFPKVIRSFSTFEAYHDPKMLMNRFFAKWREVSFQHG